MKHLKIKSISFLILAVILLSCEKDDICAAATPTTPELILRFYDISNQDDTKSVTGLKITGFDDNNNEVIISGLSLATTDSINLPLRTDANETKFKFHKDYGVNNNGTPEDTSDDIILGNPDLVTIRYEREDVYVSRACGFKTIFSNLSFSFEQDGDNWIINSEIINAIVENEFKAHVKIFH